MPEVIAKVIKVFEIIVEMLKTLKEKLTKKEDSLFIKGDFPLIFCWLRGALRPFFLFKFGVLLG